MKVAWLADDPGYLGGAEMTQAEFLAAAPDDVEVIRCRPGEVDPSVDRVVAHNVVYYSFGDLMALRDKPVTWFHHDLSRAINPEVKRWLDANADHIFCSPLQREKYGIDGICIPPPLDLAAFKCPRQSAKRRKGTCSIAQWRGPQKGAWLIEEWADANGTVDVYGDGIFQPTGPNIQTKGPLVPQTVAQTLWRYETMVFLPLEVEPFCRTIAEANAAGCKVVTNSQVGAMYWLTKDREAIKTAATDFWEAVCKSES